MAAAAEAPEPTGAGIRNSDATVGTGPPESQSVDIQALDLRFERRRRHAQADGCAERPDTRPSACSRARSISACSLPRSVASRPDGVRTTTEVSLRSSAGMCSWASSPGSRCAR